MNGEMTVSNLKPVLYELLTNACMQDSGASGEITQNLGVSLTNAVKREGVNIIQIQNVKLDSIVPQIVVALKMVDQLVQREAITVKQIEMKEEEVEAKAIEHVPKDVDDDTDPIEELCDFMYEQKMNWNKVSDLIKVRYVEFLKGKVGNTKKAMEFLEVSATSYYLAKKRLDVGIRGAEALADV